jgi:hypothetical protein
VSGEGPARSIGRVGAGLSIWRPVHLGTDEAGRAVRISLAERMVLIGGEPGGGKSGALNLIVGHAALSSDCRLVLVDGKQVELGAWRDCADEFVGPDIDRANKVLAGLRQEMDERYDALLDTGRRKVSPESGVPPIVVVFDELAYFSATVGDRKQQNEFTTAVRDLVARGRAAGVIVVAATQRPSADIIPTSLRTCSAIAGHFGAPLRRPPMSCSGTAGPGRDTARRTSAPVRAASAGCWPRAASHGGCGRPTWTTARSASWQSSPPSVAVPHGRRCDRRGHGD